MTTKADMTRDILKRDLGKKSDEQILEAVIKQTRLTKSLAKIYIKNNTAKLKEAKKAPISKEAGATKGAKNPPAKTQTPRKESSASK